MAFVREISDTPNGLPTNGDEKAWAGNGLVSEDHAAGQAARAGDAAALALIPGQAMAS